MLPAVDEMAARRRGGAAAWRRGGAARRRCGGAAAWGALDWRHSHEGECGLGDPKEAAQLSVEDKLEGGEEDAEDEART